MRIQSTNGNVFGDVGVQRLASYVLHKVGVRVTRLFNHLPTLDWVKIDVS